MRRRSKSIAAHLLAPLNILLARKLATRGGKIIESKKSHHVARVVLRIDFV
jgi:hypothetical protein